mmetsp:Transcript_7350/g.15964  ORF Transcript_7350/g.15964 Transcript_7350/m.15964 type:complete len:95 (-) Transcript_7350:801-1085(-)
MIIFQRAAPSSLTQRSIRVFGMSQWNEVVKQHRKPICIISPFSCEEKTKPIKVFIILWNFIVLSEYISNKLHHRSLLIPIFQQQCCYHPSILAI